MASRLAGPIALGAAAIVTLGFVIDQIVQVGKYEDKMREAVRAANTPLTLNDLRRLMSTEPDYLLAHFTLHVTRPGGVRLYIP